MAMTSDESGRATVYVLTGLLAIVWTAYLARTLTTREVELPGLALILVATIATLSYHRRWPT